MKQHQTNGSSNVNSAMRWKILTVLGALGLSACGGAASGGAAGGKSTLPAQDRSGKTSAGGAEISKQAAQGYKQALDEFLKDFRVEERSYVRETKSLEEAKRSMIMQERLFFRNIPLSDWVEHEMVVEVGSDLKRLQEQVSVFGGAALPAGSAAMDGRLPISKLLDNTTHGRPQASGSTNSLIPAHAVFGAQ